jgi:hypothetical protein
MGEGYPVSPVKRVILALLLGGLVVLSYVVLRLFLVPVAWATILAYVTWPAYRRSRLLMRGNATGSALLMTIILSAAFVLPLVWLTMLLRGELIGGLPGCRRLPGQRPAQTARMDCAHPVARALATGACESGIDRSDGFSHAVRGVGPAVDGGGRPAGRWRRSQCDETGLCLADAVFCIPGRRKRVGSGAPHTTAFSGRSPGCLSRFYRRHNQGGRVRARADGIGAGRACRPGLLDYRNARACVAGCAYG